ncbi:MAG: hypothetical protein ACRC1K_14270 [Planctomycetia bacterium]
MSLVGLLLILAAADALPPDAATEPTLVEVASAAAIEPASAVVVEPAAPGLPEWAVDATSVALAPFAGRYVAVGPDDCASKAAFHSHPARILELEASARRGVSVATVVSRVVTPRRWRTLSALEEEVTCLRIAVIRNRTSATALEAYYRLSQAESTLRIIEERMVEQESLIAEFDDLQKKGLGTASRGADLRRASALLQGERDQTESTVERLNIELARVLGFPADPSVRINPAFDWNHEAAAPSPETAAATAVAERSELKILRLLAVHLQPATLAATKAAVQQSVGLPGGTVDSRKFGALGWLFGPGNLCSQMETVRTTLAETTAHREREIADEARAAAVQLAARRRQYHVARQNLERLDQSLADALAKEKAGLGASAERQTLKIERATARVATITAFIAVRTAEVQLAAAMEGAAPKIACDFGPARGFHRKCK